MIFICSERDIVDFAHLIPSVEGRQIQKRYPKGKKPNVAAATCFRGPPKFSNIDVKFRLSNSLQKREYRILEIGTHLRKGF